MNVMRGIALTLMVVSFGVGVGCAQPRVITNITSSGDQVKMIYAQKNTGNTGLIQCQQQPDGSLTNCRKVAITFEPKPKK